MGLGQTPRFPAAVPVIPASTLAIAFALSACGSEDAGEGATTGAELTYHASARPIIEEKCVGCHQDGSIAPFPLDTYEVVYEFREAIRGALADGTMPPWQPADECNQYSDDFSLDDDELSILLSWLDLDAPEGNRDDYVAPDVAQDTFRADLTLTLSEPYTPKSEPDDYHCFLIEWPETEAKYVTGFRLAPDQLEMVHHVLAYIASPSDAEVFREMDREEEGPGYSCFGGPSSPGSQAQALARQFGGWVPGVAAAPFPSGTGIPVEPGSLLIVQMHYNTLSTGRLADQSSVQITVEEEVDRPALNFLATNPQWLQKGGMTIPAGDSAVVYESDIPMGRFVAALGGSQIGLGEDDPFMIHRVALHMHELGTSASVEVIRANENENGSADGDQCLLEIPDWDFHWQGSYALQEPVRVEPGDLVRLRCHFDNSLENQAFEGGERRAPQNVEWGDGTRDEMCLAGVYVTAP